ncbi:MAG: S1C family serine protease, partial [Candidatus Nanopelagicales bacterium]
MTQSPFDPPTSYGLSYTTPSSERPRRSTPLSAVVVISLLIGALTGGISGWLAADFFQNFSGNNSNQIAVSNETNQAQNNAAQLPAIKPLEGSIPAIVQVVQPSVVSISASGAGGTGTGSGFIYRPDGYIITNNHVISTAAGSGEIEVTLFDRSTYPARLIGRNSSYDLAVLKIEKEGLTPLSIGNSDQLQVGDST